MADLRTDYKDDVLDTSKNEKRKYNLIQNADGTFSLEDVTAYTQVGDSFGAADINTTNKKVNEMDCSLNGCSLEQEGEDFFIVGADSVRKKLGSGELKILKVGSGAYYGKVKADISSLLPEKYTELTNNNFFFRNEKYAPRTEGGAIHTTLESISYNPSTGQLSASGVDILLKDSNNNTVALTFSYYEVWVAYVE